MVIEGKSREEIRAEEKAQWEEMDIEAHMEYYLERGLDKKGSHEASSQGPGVKQARYLPGAAVKFFLGQLV